MTLPIVIVTGPMRSGTSAVAAITHRLGYYAALLMTPPQPPRWHPDYEDFEALSTIMKIWPMGTDVTNKTQGMFAVWFEDYLRRRVRAAQQMHENSGGWVIGATFKSPLYAPFIANMRNLCEASDIEAVVIMCSRAVDDRKASNRAANSGVDPDALGRHEDAIDAGIAKANQAVDIDMHIQYERLLENPGDVGSFLATKILVDSGEGRETAEEVIALRDRV